MISHRLGATAHRVCPGGHTSQFYAGRSIPSIGPKASTGRSRDLATRIQVKAALWDRIVSFVRRQSPNKPTEEESTTAMMERKNAVLVFGASGRVGSRVVQELLNSGEVVVASVRSAEGMAEALNNLGDIKNDKLIVEEGINIADASKLNDKLFKGVSSVIICAGKRQQDKDCENIDYLGVQNIVDAAKRLIPETKDKKTQILSMSTPEDLKKWERLDDVIMGGQSESKISLVEEGTGMIFTGKVIVEGGGFCAQRTISLDVDDLTDYDGISLRVKGDGQIYKMNIKTKPQEDIPESTFQATFETLDNEWKDIEIPWHEFLPVKRSNYEPSEPPIDLSTVKRFALVSSRFSFNGMTNPKFKSDDFSLEVQGGIGVFKSQRPVVTLLSAGGVERNAIIGDDAEKRQSEIPIVMLNPGGILNYKYDGEIALRDSGLPYSIVRSTGFKDLTEECLLEAGQGDTFVGLMSYNDVARTVVAASKSPDAAYKTFETRRSTSRETQGKRMGPADFQRLFLKLVVDWRRASVGIPPFPASVPPPPPPDGEQKEKILKEVARLEKASAEARAS